MIRWQGAVLAALMLFGLLWLRSDQSISQEPLQLYQGIPLDATLLHLDKRALDEAYHQQLLLLFSVWMRQQAGDNVRLQNGLRLARRAYHTVATQIAKREQELQQEGR